MKVLTEALLDEKEVLSTELIKNIDAYWRAANYISVGQLYLRDNPLLKEPAKIRAH